MQAAVVQGTWVRVGDRRVALHVVELGLACCGVEAREARRTGQAVGALGTQLVAGEPGSPGDPGAGDEQVDLNVLVVAGTVTTRLAPELAEAFAQLPEPRAVLAFGACAATGGPYWDSYSVLPGAHVVVPVDVWVPGCPPRPEDLVAGLAEVLRGRA
jgi:NADH-quinone oxidoreductase subunit B